MGRASLFCVHTRPPMRVFSPSLTLRHRPPPAPPPPRLNTLTAVARSLADAGGAPVAAATAAASESTAAGSDMNRGGGAPCGVCVRVWEGGWGCAGVWSEARGALSRAGGCVCFFRRRHPAHKLGFSLDHIMKPSLLLPWDAAPSTPDRGAPPPPPSPSPPPPPPPVDALPDDILRAIFARTGLLDAVVTVPRVCKRWRDAAAPVPGRGAVSEVVVGGEPRLRERVSWMGRGGGRSPTARWGAPDPRCGGGTCGHSVLGGEGGRGEGGERGSGASPLPHAP